ncbi:MAG: hypothetical protein QOI10_3222 [Solirubrobacterales bacterium]|jgi:hypothetical protein|nr:hypothetical protein [Solirubrobacterales bacterium]
MTVIIVGDREAAAALAETLEIAASAQVWAQEEAAGRDSVVALARALTEFEVEAMGQELESIVLADASDAALAAALVGTKLLIDVSATPAARDASTANGRLIAQLAAAYTPAA